MSYSPFVDLAFASPRSDLPLASSIKAPAAAAPTAIPVFAAGTIARPASRSASFALLRMPLGELFFDRLFAAGVFFFAVEAALVLDVFFAGVVFFLAIEVFFEVVFFIEELLLFDFAFVVLISNSLVVSTNR